MKREEGEQPEEGEERWIMRRITAGNGFVIDSVPAQTSGIPSSNSSSLASQPAIRPSVHPADVRMQACIAGEVGDGTRVMPGDNCTLTKRRLLLDLPARPPRFSLSLSLLLLLFLPAGRAGEWTRERTDGRVQICSPAHWWTSQASSFPPSRQCPVMRPASRPRFNEAYSQRSGGSKR
jgi:hypothetical protein